MPGLFGNIQYSDLAEAVSDTKKEIDAHILLLRQAAADATREQFGLSTASTLAPGLKAWYGNLPQYAKNHVYRDSTMGLLGILAGDIGNVEDEIVGRLAKEVTGSFIEDWKDGMLDVYSQNLKELIEEIENTQSETETVTSDKITFTDAGGEEKVYYLEAQTEESPNAYFFRNTIESALDEYGGFMDNRQKARILLEAAKKLMEGTL